MIDLKSKFVQGCVLTQDVNLKPLAFGPTGIRARIIADSINPAGDRLTTVEMIFNRWILAELNTHRILSRNSASSRAIPVKKVLKQVWSDPAHPVSWGSNKPGMQAGDELVGLKLWIAKRLFFWARIPALIVVWLLSKVGLHKQVANRLLEPWVWHTAVVSATEWDNFFKLRDHKDAQPEFQVLARCTRMVMDASQPTPLGWGEWHLPYMDEKDLFAGAKLWQSDSSPAAAFMSVARCAAVSYVRQHERREPAKDLELSDRLRTSGHWSPFEHVAQAHPGPSGNFNGWEQLRKKYRGEDGRS